jgi:hypothetical protein
MRAQVGFQAAALAAIAAIAFLRDDTAIGATGNAPENIELSPQDFAYRMPVVGTGDAAAYRLTLPLAVYQ